MIEAEMPLVGQLNPWPGATTPGTTGCAVVTPTPTAVTNSTTLITVTSSSVVTTTNPASQRDTVTILSVTVGKGQGTTRYTITAISSHNTDPLPILIVTGTGVNPLGQSQMTSLGGGNYIIDVAVKHGLDTITVTSSYGGQMTLTL